MSATRKQLALLVVSALIGGVVATVPAAAGATAPVRPAEDCPTIAFAPYGDPGKATAVGRFPEAGAEVCYRFVASTGPHLIRKPDRNADYEARIEDDRGAVVCQDAPSCVLATGRDHTLVLRHRPHRSSSGAADLDYQVALKPLGPAEGCQQAAGLAFTTPARRTTVVTTMQVDCLTFVAEPGDVLTAARDSAVGARFVDENGAEACGAGHPGACLIVRGGRVRLVTEPRGDMPTTHYEAAARRINRPVGCPVVEPGTFGGAPALAPASTDCRLLRTPAAGRYLVSKIAEDVKDDVTIFDASGRQVCTSDVCDLPAGDLLMIAGGPDSLHVAAYATVFIPWDGSGCATGADDGFVRAPMRGSYRFLGQVDCHLLPSPAQARLAIATPSTAHYPRGVRVLDAGGAVVCRGDASDCLLKGVAPFRVLNLNRYGETHDYLLSAQRRDRLHECPTLPAGQFGARTGATVTFDANRFVGCLRLPADRPTTEFFGMDRTAGKGEAHFEVWASDRDRPVCSVERGASRWAECHRQDEEANTVVLYGSPTTDSFLMTRKDPHNPKGCRTARPTEFAAGLTATATSEADVHCFAVTAAPSDLLWIDARDKSSATRVVVEPGSPSAPAVGACGYAWIPCGATGADRYQVFVWNTKASLKSVPFALDVWRVGGAAGAPAACTKVPSAAKGFGPFRGTLTAKRPGACLAVPVHSHASFAVTVNGGANHAKDVWPSMVGKKVQFCTKSADAHYACDGQAEQGTSTELVILSAGNNLADVEYEVKGVCRNSWPCGPTEARH